MWPNYTSSSWMEWIPIICLIKTYFSFLLLTAAQKFSGCPLPPQKKLICSTRWLLFFYIIYCTYMSCSLYHYYTCMLCCSCSSNMNSFIGLGLVFFIICVYGLSHCIAQYFLFRLYDSPLAIIYSASYWRLFVCLTATIFLWWIKFCVLIKYVTQPNWTSSTLVLCTCCTIHWYFATPLVRGRAPAKSSFGAYSVAERL